nr:MAG TPA: hypothetical protein [Caudoviricetes sp.]
MWDTFLGMRREISCLTRGSRTRRQPPGSRGSILRA